MGVHLERELSDGRDLGMSELLNGRRQDTQSSALKTGAPKSLCDLRQLLSCPAKPRFSSLQQHRPRPLLPRPLFLRGTPTPTSLPDPIPRWQEKASSQL